MPDNQNDLPVCDRVQQIDDFLARVRDFLLSPGSASYGYSDTYRDLSDEMAKIAFGDNAEQVIDVAHETGSGTGKRARVLARIMKLLDNRIEARSGWPVIPDDAFSEFQDVVRDLQRLAFAPDEDNDSALDIAMVRSKTHRLYSVAAPHTRSIYNRDEMSDREVFLYVSEAMRASDLLASFSRSVLNGLDWALRERAEKMDADDTTQQELAALSALIDAGDVEAAETAIQAFIDKHDSKDERDEDDHYRRIDENLDPLLDEFGRLVRDRQPVRIEDALAELRAGLVEFEAQVSTIGNVTDKLAYGKAEHKFRNLLWKHRFRFGQAVLRDVIIPYNRLSQQDRVLRRLGADTVTA